MPPIARTKAAYFEFRAANVFSIEPPTLRSSAPPAHDRPQQLPDARRQSRAVVSVPGLAKHFGLRWVGMDRLRERFQSQPANHRKRQFRDHLAGMSRDE